MVRGSVSLRSSNHVTQARSEYKHALRQSLSIWIDHANRTLPDSSIVCDPPYLFTPETPAARGPILLASFIAILLGSLLCILFLLRWLLRPYHQLVDEAERASVKSDLLKSQDEAEFVLETFQSVVGQLQEQRKELERLSQQARERANSAEKFSERIVASLPSALIAFDGSGRSMALNMPGRALLEVNGTALGEPFQSLLSNHQELAELVDDCLKRGTVYRRTELQP